jgi:hypothetical protein
MIRPGSLGIATAAAFAACLGCALLEPAMQAAVPAAAHDPAAGALIVLPGARDVRRSSRNGARGVNYRLDVEFPAAGAIGDIVKRLERRGWFPLREDPRNSWAATSLLRGWTTFVDASGTTPTRTYNWWSEWTNLGGDRVSYGFQYEAPEHGGTALRSLFVAAGFYPAGFARELREEAAREAELFAKTHPAAAAAAKSEKAPARTAIPARAGDAFLLSGPAGEAAIRITATPGGGDQVAYRWRFRKPAGGESSGAVAEASTLTAGGYRLFWLPHSAFATASASHTAHEAAIGYLAGVDVIPIPGAQFDSLDLAQAHALATLIPDRNQRLAAAASSVPNESDVRREATLEAGKSMRIDSGRAVLVQGRDGTGVIEIVRAGADSVKYRWRFRSSAASADASGEADAAERPFPELRVGPYSLEWQVRSISEAADAVGAGGAAWSADVKYLPEELSLATIPAGDAARLDLASVSGLRGSR